MAAGHVRMLRFLKSVPEDTQLHSSIIYAISQLALLGASHSTWQCLFSNKEREREHRDFLFVLRLIVAFMSGSSKEVIGSSCFKKLKKLFVSSPNESIREYALQSIAHLATNCANLLPHEKNNCFSLSIIIFVVVQGQDRLWLSGMGEALCRFIIEEENEQAGASYLKIKSFALLALGNTAVQGE